MKFWKVKSDYLSSIRDIDSNILQQTNMIGIIYRLNGFIYFLPIVELNESDFEENGSLKKSVPTIMRISDQHNSPLCKCLFSNMFPIPYNALESYSVMSLDQKQRNLQNNKLSALSRQNNRIEKALVRLYKQKKKNIPVQYLNFTPDFEKLEQFVLEYENKNYGKHINRFPDNQYFIENPYSTGISEYYLMNKNTKVMKLEYNNDSQQITKIIELINVSYAPLECFEQNCLSASSITK